MSQYDPAPAGDPTPPTTGPAGTPPPPPAPASSGAADPSYDERSGAGETADRRAPAKEALSGTRTSHLWVGLLLMVVVLVLLAVFILQNTQDVDVSYFGATAQSPLAVALLIAFAAGLLVAGIAGTLRIWQLRRRVRKLDR